jgi:hypothetical protein
LYPVASRGLSHVFGVQRGDTIQAIVVKIKA